MGIEFYAGEGFNISNLSGSGLGFYGSTFGSSVDVGAYQDSTFITNSAGTSQGPQVDNVKYYSANSGTVNGVGPVNLLAIPNYQATLQIRFTNATAVRTQNAQVRIYDRSSINNNPSGVTCRVAELVHPWFTASPDGSGDVQWYTLGGSGVVLDLIASPSISGLSPNGPSSTSTIHDHYIIISTSPDSIGSKTNFGLYYSLEYL